MRPSCVHDSARRVLDARTDPDSRPCSPEIRRLRPSPAVTVRIGRSRKSRGPRRSDLVADDLGADVFMARESKTLDLREPKPLTLQKSTGLRVPDRP